MEKVINTNNLEECGSCCILPYITNVALLEVFLYVKWDNGSLKNNQILLLSKLLKIIKVSRPREFRP